MVRKTVHRTENNQLLLYPHARSQATNLAPRSAKSEHVEIVNFLAATHIDGLTLNFTM